MQIYHHTEGGAAPTSLVYSAAAYVGWGDLVYLYGNISEPDKTPGCCLGIPAYNQPTIQAIGGFVVVIWGVSQPGSCPRKEKSRWRKNHGFMPGVIEAGSLAH